MTKMAMIEYFLILRPLSLTCSVIATIVTAAVVANGEREIFFSFRFFRALMMAISIQLGANLTNTYYDFLNGVDTVNDKQKEYRVDNGLATGAVSIRGIQALMYFLYAIGLLCIFPVFLTTDNPFISIIFAFGIFLAYFYTASLHGFGGLKYLALGDVIIFLCFGPLLMQGVSIILKDSMDTQLYIYSVPLGFCLLYTSPSPRD